jgi:hypothetical protein
VAQALGGDVCGARPGAFSVAGRAKWDAWARQRGGGREAAQAEYAALVAVLLEKHRPEAAAVLKAQANAAGAPAAAAAAAVAAAAVALSPQKAACAESMVSSPHAVQPPAPARSITPPPPPSSSPSSSAAAAAAAPASGSRGFNFNLNFDPARLLCLLFLLLCLGAGAWEELLAPVAVWVPLHRHGLPFAVGVQDGDNASAVAARACAGLPPPPRLPYNGGDFMNPGPPLTSAQRRLEAARSAERCRRQAAGALERMLAIARDRARGGGGVRGTAPTSTSTATSTSSLAGRGGSLAGEGGRSAWRRMVWDMEASVAELTHFAFALGDNYTAVAEVPARTRTLLFHRILILL